ncbi:hypothetical protein CHS0354_011592 [Potamilus streckersoni]|uniref:Uncharacterized protein n=1 Tax=Potamilus streckersoni TaxID=2493646 RepID=A0AAE0VIM4_9BIVA|nr:hypothetical protein CHS0354_011592 [Potamilus streckersoni]
MERLDTCFTITNIHSMISLLPDTNQEDKPPTLGLVESSIVKVGAETISGIKSKENEKDTVMEILQLVNEHSGKLEKNMVEYAALAFWDFTGQYVFYTTHKK